MKLLEKPHFSRVKYHLDRAMYIFGNLCHLVSSCVQSLCSAVDMLLAESKPSTEENIRAVSLNFPSGFVFVSRICLTDNTIRFGAVWKIAFCS